MKNFYKPDFDKMKNIYILMSKRGNGKTLVNHWITFRKLYAKERKKLMGEIILTLSITLILTVISSFWLGYSYGKLRTIKSYETSQKQIFIDYMSQDKQGEEHDTDNQ